MSAALWPSLWRGRYLSADFRLDTTKGGEKPRSEATSLVGEGGYANEHVNNFGRLDESEGEAQTCRDRLSGRSEVESGGDYCADAVRFC
mgnify:FL=1